MKKFAKEKQKKLLHEKKLIEKGLIPDIKKIKEEAEEKQKTLDKLDLSLNQNLTMDEMGVLRDKYGNEVEKPKQSVATSLVNLNKIKQEKVKSLLDKQSGFQKRQLQ